jgi:hypothetical protein
MTQRGMGQQVTKTSQHRAMQRVQMRKETRQGRGSLLGVMAAAAREMPCSRGTSGRMQQGRQTLLQQQRQQQRQP